MQINFLQDIRYRLLVSKDPTIKEQAKLVAIQVINDYKETNEGYSIPKIETDEIVSEPMNMTISQIYHLLVQNSLAHDSIENLVPNSARLNSLN